MTLAEAREYVLSRLGVSTAESGLVALVDAQLDQEYQRLVLKYRLNVDTADLVLTADDPVVELPDDVAEILKINRGDIVLSPVTWDEFANLVAEGVDGVDISSYLLSGLNQIRVFPTPDVNDNAGLALWYAAAAPSWTGSDSATTSESPDYLPAAFHDLPAERVVAYLALVEEEIGLAQVAETRATLLEADFRRHLGRRGGMGSDTIRIKGM